MFFLSAFVVFSNFYLTKKIAGTAASLAKRAACHPQLGSTFFLQPPLLNQQQMRIVSMGPTSSPSASLQWADTPPGPLFGRKEGKEEGKEDRGREGRGKVGPIMLVNNATNASFARGDF